MAQQYWRRLIGISPEFLFLFFSTLGGLVLIALIPPVAGGNEQFNFQRVATVSAFHVLVEPAQIPSGTLRFLDAAHGQFNPRQLPPYHYSAAQFDAVASIPLDAETPATLPPNPISVLNPVAYVPQVAVYWLGEAFGWSPLTLFYFGRLAGLAAAIGLTFFAIRRMPFHQYGLCAVALLPTLAFTRSTLDADQVTTGLCFLFLATILSLATGTERISLCTILYLAVIGFLTAQCKSAYLVLLALAFAIPVERYSSRRRWLLASLAITIPGIVVSVGWMIAVQRTYFAGIQYYVGGVLVHPQEQIATILNHPFDFAVVLARTLFLSPLLPIAFFGLIGVLGPPVFMPAVAYPMVVAALGAVWIADGASQTLEPSRVLRWLAAGVFLAGFGLILTLLYLQWNGVGAPVIKGFNGRYLYPFAPLLMLFIPSKKIAVLGLGAPAWTAILGLVAAAFTLGVTWTTYWA